jgi:phosphodiester glycosidase
MAVKRNPTVLLLAAAVILGGASGPGTGASPEQFPQPNSWPSVATVDHNSELLGPGVMYERWRLHTSIGPLTVHVTTVDLRNPLVSLAVSTHNGQVVGAGEALSAMANRAHAEAAINADYFDINDTGAPLNVVAIGGRFIHGSSGAAALVVGQNNAVSMRAVTLRATLADALGTKLDIGSINDWGKNTTLSLLTPEFGSVLSDADMEIVLVPVASGGFRVAAVGQSLAQLLPLLPGEVGVVARGAEQVGRLSAFAANGVVTIAFDGNPPAASIVWAVGGGPLLLHDGATAVDTVVPAAQETDVRYPVTGAGLSSDGGTLWLVAVDGRAPAQSVGITRPMLRALLARLGAAQAMAFDSGGSTEIAIRHLGDAEVSVANTPSDGRERAIADALLVVNAAKPGPAAQIILRAPAPAVLVGSHLQFRASAVDANMQPVSLDPAQVRFQFDSACCASIDPAGVVTGVAPGAVNLVARGVSASSPPQPIAVVSSVDALSITGIGRSVASGAGAPLQVVASMNDGRLVAVDASAVQWSAAGDGHMLADGSFAAGSVPGIADVTASAGGGKTSLRVLVGEHPVLLTALKTPREIVNWRFASNPAVVSGIVDGLAAPDGAAALHLDYNFALGGATRAAYAETTLPVIGEPLAFTIEVYGDANGEWLRGGYRNADGIVDSVTLSRHVDWTGWKMLRIAIPPQARWPIVWTRLYAAEPRADAIETGDLWFRNFAASYAGPASSGS